MIIIIIIIIIVEMLFFYISLVFDEVNTKTGIKT